MNFINNWKYKSIKFTQYNIFIKTNIIDDDGSTILKEYNCFYSYNKNSADSILNIYAIWMSDLMISHVRKSKHIFIDCTWYQPQGFKQILVILFKDIIINKKIPCCFMILNNKRYEIYENV